MQTVHRGVHVSELSSGQSALAPRTYPNRGNRGVTVGRQQILAVDDDVIIPEIIRFFLGKAYEIMAATTGAEALARVRRDRIDLVLLDHRLPDRTGLEVLTELRSIQPILPVVMLTGYGSEWICAAAFKLGVPYSGSFHRVSTDANPYAKVRYPGVCPLRSVFRSRGPSA